MPVTIKKVARASVPVAAALLAGGAAFWCRHVSPVAAVMASPPAGLGTFAVRLSHPAGGPNAQSGGESHKHAGIDYRQAFAKASDYRAFARDALLAAQSGNGDAQYYLFKALDYCAHEYKFFFERRGQALTLSEGLQLATQRRLSIEVAQSVHDRCHTFADTDEPAFGSADDWLAQATELGQPMAEATSATRLMLQDSLRERAQSSGTMPVQYPWTPVARDNDPRALLRAALTSGDPEVLSQVGEDQLLLNPEKYADADVQDGNVERYAWMLVACQRGLDCSNTAPWVEGYCGTDPQCLSVTGSSDLVRRWSGDNWPAVQQRAGEIDCELRAHQWALLGLGP